MKKVIIDFQKVQYRTRHLPKFNCRPGRGTSLGMAYKSDADKDEDDDDDDDDDAAEKKVLLKTIQKRVTKLLEGRATKEEVSAIAGQLSFLTKKKNEKGQDVEAPFPIETLREMADEKSGAMAKIVEMGLQIQELKAAGERQIKDMSIRAQVADWQEKNKEALKKVIAGESKNVPTLEIRVAASPMLVSTVNAGGSPYIGRVEQEAGINGFLRFDNTFWNYLKKGRTGAPTYVWVNMTNPQGDAAFIGPGVAKPGISFAMEAENSVAKKIADSAKAGTELLQDIDGMTSFIEDELRAKVDIKINETLMANSAGSGTVPAGIRYYAQDVAGASFVTAFTALKTSNPNYMDAIRSAIAALRSGKLRGPITVFINPVDAANMDMAKANDSGVYTLPPFVTSNGKTIAGATVVEDDNITIGSFLAAFLGYYRILIYKDFSITWGWENDDFTKNLVTAVGEMRMHQFVNGIHTGFAFYDQFTDVVAVITEV